MYIFHLLLSYWQSPSKISRPSGCALQSQIMRKLFNHMILLLFSHYFDNLKAGFREDHVQTLALKSQKTINKFILTTNNWYNYIFKYIQYLRNNEKKKDYQNTKELQITVHSASIGGPNLPGIFLVSQCASMCILMN